MKSPLPFLGGLIVLTTGVAVGRNLVDPKARNASRAEIEAVLPASLKTADAPDPAGEARYGRFVALVDRVFGAAQEAEIVPKNDADEIKMREARGQVAGVVGSLGALLDEGSIRTPAREAGQLFPEDTKFRALSKAIASCASDAAKRGDRTACACMVEANLKLGRALIGRQGVLIDELVAIAIESIANRSAYEAEMADGLDAKGRTAVLALMPAEAGPMPELGDALRRDFQSWMMPFLLHPSGHLKEAVGNGNGTAGDPEGTFDPIATARLIGRIDDATIADVGRPFRFQEREADRIAAKAAAGLPNGQNLHEMPDSLEKLWLEFNYRLAMNSSPNTIGRGLVSGMVYDLGATAARRAAGRNLVRTAILLRMDKRPAILDPYADGPLHIDPKRKIVDPKRKIVWSVGENGKDDGGQIGQGGANGQPDFGYPYGEGAWHPSSTGTH